MQDKTMRRFSPLLFVLPALLFYSVFVVGSLASTIRPQLF